MRARKIRKKFESSLTLPHFQMCCANGQAILALLRHISAEMRDLLTRNDVVAKVQGEYYDSQSSAEFHLYER
jgi:hypothetical protein